MAGETGVADFALLFRAVESLDHAACPVGKIGIVIVNHRVDLPKIQTIRSQPLQRLLEHLHGDGGVAAVRADLGHQKHFVAVAAPQRLAHPFFGSVIVVLPGVIEEIDAAVDRLMHDRGRLLEGCGGAKVMPSQAEHRDLIGMPAEFPAWNRLLLSAYRHGNSAEREACRNRRSIVHEAPSRIAALWNVHRCAEVTYKLAQRENSEEREELPGREQIFEADGLNFSLKITGKHIARTEEIVATALRQRNVPVALKPRNEVGGHHAVSKQISSASGGICFGNSSLRPAKYLICRNRHFHHRRSADIADICAAALPDGGISLDARLLGVEFSGVLLGARCVGGAAAGGRSLDPRLLGLRRRRVLWHGGYWGPHVGFYGGVNYGFGFMA